MAAASQPSPVSDQQERRSDSPSSSGHATTAEERRAFRAALGRYKGTCLAAIRLAQGSLPRTVAIRPAASGDEIIDYLDQPAALEALVARLPAGSRLALSQFALTETTSLPLAGLTHTLGILGREPGEAIVKLLELGLLAIEPSAEVGAVDDFAAVLQRGSPTRLFLRAHPAAAKGVRTARPDRLPPRAIGLVRQVREADGLEPILRLGALWQRVGAEPLRQTQQGTLYKRDRDRLVDDPVLAAPIADALKPLSRLPELWMALAFRVGLIGPDQSGERLVAASPAFWTENAVHLPQMIATAWMGLRDWHELDTKSGGDHESRSALPYLRFALLLWLSALEESEWAALADLAAELSERWPEWDRLTFVDRVAEPLADKPQNGETRRRGRGRAAAGSAPRGLTVLESVLLGAAYPLGLVRAAEEQGSGRLVQLTPLGRYVLALGPTPPPRARFDRFLFVQPNFEVIAYRQGLTPQLVGRLSGFAWWSQIGAALELKLTRESIVHGLEGDCSPEALLATLARHSQRALPPGVVDAVNNWASRRERVTYYAAVTLIEFGSVAERDAALAFWPASDRAAPIAVGERFLLVEDEKTVPFDRLRLISSRDYRRPPEVCAVVEPDGVTLSLDPTRSDLMVEAELARFADLVPDPQPAHGHASMRRFAVTTASLRRGASRGMPASKIVEWYRRRTGGEVSPAVRLLLRANTARIPTLKATRITVLSLPSPELLDGLLQHPATGPVLGDRLGPTSVAIDDDDLPALRRALEDLGITLDGE
jgi:hypothetical protein